MVILGPVHPHSIAILSSLPSMGHSVCVCVHVHACGHVCVCYNANQYNSGRSCWLFFSGFFRGFSLYSFSCFFPWVVGGAGPTMHPKFWCRCVGPPAFSVVRVVLGQCNRCMIGV